MVKCKITEVVPLSKINENPVLVHFQNGTVLPSAENGLECMLARNGEHQLHAIVAQADNAYVGRAGDGFADDLLRNFVGIRNRVTNKIRLVEVEQCSLLSKHYQHDAAATTDRTTDTQQAYKIMLKSFGGKAANRMLEKKDKMRLNVDVVKEQLDKTIQAEPANTTGTAERDAFDDAIAEREEVMKTILPKMNIEATRVEEVYQLTDLIDEDLLARMNDDALAVLRAERADLPIKATYLLDIIKQCQEAKQPESATNLRRIKICIYVDALINFLKGLRKAHSKMISTNFSDIAERVEVDIRKNFRQPDTLKIIKTNYIQHKIICYVVILSLLASDKFELETAPMVEAINTSKSQLFTMTSMSAVRRKPRTDMLMLKLPSQLRTVTRTQFKKSRRTL